MKDKVSIIIPVYNGANYMREAIDSALAQTYKNLEVIVVNDGSNDDGQTSKIAKSYGDKIVYLEKENGGVSTALNLAIKKMTGKYFSWLSHDDLYYPEKIEKQMEEMKKHDDHTIIYSNFDFIDGNGVKYDTIYLDHETLIKKPDYAVFRGAISGTTLLIPKKAFDEYGLFDEELRCVQDYLKWFEMLDSYKFIHLDAVLGASRVHDRQVTNTSPKMVTEGDWLWTKMAEEYPLEKKIKLSGSEYLFYYDLRQFLDASPYKGAAEACKKHEEECVEKIKNKAKDVSVTVVVIDNGNSTDLEKTIDSITNQNKECTILIEGKTKYKDYKNTKDRKDSIKNIKSDIYSFINAGNTVNEEWLKEQIPTIYLLNKAVIVTNNTNLRDKDLIDNPASFATPIDTVLFYNKYKADYQNDYQYMYEMASLGGSVVIADKNYLEEFNKIYNVDDLFEYQGLVLRDHHATKYQLACLNYDITCIYNKYEKTNKKVYMYEQCNELKELYFSRSFRLFKKYIDRKRRK